MGFNPDDHSGNIHGKTMAKFTKKNRLKTMLKLSKTISKKL